MNYTEEQIKETVCKIVESNDGLNFIEILLDKLGAWERGCNFQNRDMDTFNRGKREQGLWLLDLLKESSFDKFIEIEKRRRKDLCQKKIKQINQD